MTQKRLIAVGKKLRTARHEQKLSLRELASRAGVSASLLSQIECGKVTPSASSLYQVATALALPIHAFFPETDEQAYEQTSEATENRGSKTEGRRVAENQPDYAIMERRPLTKPLPETTAMLKNVGPIVRSETRMVLELMGGATWARLTPGIEEGMEFLEVTYEPGYSTGTEMLYHMGREFCIVIEGTILLELGFERYTLEVGDSAVYASTTPHRITNISAGVTRTIWVRFTPGRASS